MGVASKQQAATVDGFWDEDGGGSGWEQESTTTCGEEVNPDVM